MMSNVGGVRVEIGLRAAVVGLLAVALVACVEEPAETVVDAPSEVEPAPAKAKRVEAPSAERVRRSADSAGAPVAAHGVEDQASGGSPGGEIQAPAADTNKQQLDKQLAEGAGVLGALNEGEPVDGLVTGPIGGLIGEKGTQIGAGGLGSRGSGLGGGGATHGLRGGSVGYGMGTKGVGSGSGAMGSGYGRGASSTGRSYGGGAVVVGSHPYRTAASPRANTEQYTNYGVNDVELAEKDRLSTFSVDVDTASYAISRSKLTSGRLPPTSAVRVEEFVNYFDYAYAPPKSDVFGVHVEAAPNPWVANHHLLRIGVKGAEPSIEEKPVKLTFLVDVSGSMNAPGKLDLVQRSLHYLVDQSGPEDSIAIATYAGATREVLQPTPITQKQRIHQAIDSLRSSGGTAMEDGMTLAYRMAQDSYLDGAENRVIVLSDGDANIGRTGFQGILSSIEQYAGKGITMSTIGFGRGNYKDTLMEQLANKGDGNYYYIDSMSEARKVFGTDLAGTTRTIARDVKIQVAFDPDTVLAYRLIGYENRDIADADFRNDKVDAGEIGSGHEVTAIYDVVLADDLSGGLGEVRLRHKQPGPDRPATETAVSMKRRAVRYELGDASRDFKLATGAAMFAEVFARVGARRGAVS